jgi:ubiquinone/menaquinone biosynthesis C-methylase UbiE/DNA-binding transcriptional ArsR family regulator
MEQATASTNSGPAASTNSGQATSTNSGQASPQLLIGRLDSLSDPIRLRLLRVLERNELGVADLCDLLQLPQSTVSRHLKVLADMQWLTSRRQGTNNLYRMAADQMPLDACQLWGIARDQSDLWPAARHDQQRLAELHRQKHEAQAAFFAGAAQEWDKLRGELYGHYFSQAAMLSMLPPDSVVADLGCGTGSIAAAIAPFVARVICVDQSPAMLQAAARRTAAMTNIELRQGTLPSLPLDSHSCDAALLVLTLTYVPAPLPVLMEAARILRPHGRLVVVDLLAHDREDFQHQTGQQQRGFDSAQIIEMLKQAGLDHVRSRPLPFEPTAKGPPLFVASGTAVHNANNNLHNAQHKEIRP